MPLGAVAGCRHAGVPWAAIAGVPLLGCHAGVPLLGAIARRHCWGAIAGRRHAGVLLGAIAGCHCWGAIAGVPLLGATMQGCCWVPLLGPIAGIAGCHCWMLGTNFGGVHVGCHCWVPCWGAIAGCHCEKKLTRVVHHSPLHLSLQIGLCYLGSMLV